MLTAQELSCEQWELDALVKVRDMLASGQIKHDPQILDHHDGSPAYPMGFSMDVSGVKKDCGTTACIGGWVAQVGGHPNMDEYVGDFLLGPKSETPFNRLYWENTESGVTPARAVEAINNTLEFGDPRWTE